VRIFLSGTVFFVLASLFHGWTFEVTENLMSNFISVAI
jgi:hypothetical protein